MNHLKKLIIVLAFHTISTPATPLEEAVLNNNLSEVQRLIKAGADVNAQNENSLTPLHLAVDNNFPEIVRELIAARADVNAKNKKGNTPLHLAVNKNFPEIIRELIAAGADVKAKNALGFTPLDFASGLNFPEAILALLKAGAYGAKNAHLVLTLTNPSILENHMNQQLNQQLQSTLENHMNQQLQSTDDPTIKKIYNEAFAILQQQESIKINYMDQAALHNSPEVIAALKEAGADVNSQDFNGNTPLLTAAVNRNLEALKALLECGADPNIENFEHNTPLDAACDAKLRAFAEHNKRVTPNIKDKGLASDEDIVDMLLRANANPHHEDSKGRTALVIARQTDNRSAIKSFTKIGGKRPVDLLQFLSIEEKQRMNNRPIFHLNMLNRLQDLLPSEKEKDERTYEEKQHD